MSALPAAGTIVADRYRLDAPAPGVDGAFAATDSRLEREVMVRLFPVAGWSAEDRSRFQRDVKTAARLAHANVAGVLDFGTDAALGVDFVVSEMLRGEQLAALLAQRGTPPFPFALRVLQEAAAGVAAGHRAGIVHGEIHPGTLFLSRGEEDRRVRVRVTGFGARSAAALRSSAARYAAPEALRRGGELNAASDVFSLGVVALELLAGLPAQWGSTLAALVRGQPAELPALGQLRPELPASLLEAVQRALSLDPSARFADAAGFAEALSRVPVPSEARAAPAVVEPPVVEPPVVEPAAAAEPPAAPAPAAPPPAPPAPAAPARGASRVSAPGWKVASTTDLGDHLYIPPALLDSRKPAAAAPAPAPPARPAPAPVAPAAAASVAAPAPVPAPPAPVAAPAVVVAAPVAPVAAVAPEPVAVAVVPAEVEAPIATAPVRIPRLGAGQPKRHNPVLIGGGVTALLVVVAAVALASSRGEAPAAGGSVPVAQQRLAAPLPTATQPAAPVASNAETAPQTADAAAPAVDPRAEEARRREEERRREEQRKRDEARRLEEQQRAQQAAQQTAQQPAPGLRQVAVPVAPPTAPAPMPSAPTPERTVAVTTVAREEAAEVRPAAPVVDPNRIYGPGEVDDTPDLVNGPELIQEAARRRPMSDPGGGRVVLGFVVLENGRVDPSSISVVSTTAARYNSPGRSVVARARFQPGTLNGRPVKVRTQLPLIFPAQ